MRVRRPTLSEVPSLSVLPRLEKETRLAKQHAAPAWSGWYAVRDELYNAAVFFHSVNLHLQENGREQQGGKQKK